MIFVFVIPQQSDFQHIFFPKQSLDLKWYALLGKILPWNLTNFSQQINAAEGIVWGSENIIFPEGRTASCSLAITQ